MVFTTFLTLALATGFAAAKPINAPTTLPAYPKRDNFNRFGNSQSFNSQSFNSGLNSNNFNFIDGFNNFNNQEQVIQIQEQNLRISDNGFQQQVVQQVNQVLVVDQRNNGFNRDLNNLFRKSNFRNQRRDESTVMLVVQQIQTSVVDDRGNAFQQDIFVQSALVANRGARSTNTLMLFEADVLVATQILGNNFNNNNNNDFFGNSNRNRNNGGIPGVAGPTDGGIALPTKTAGIQLFGARPTWSQIVEDPAATLGAIWQNELQDLQNNEQDGADNQINVLAASQVLSQLPKQTEAKAQASVTALA